MSVEPEKINVEDFLDYRKKTNAEFAAAIRNIEIAMENCIKKLDFIGAYKLLKIQLKLENLSLKKGFEKDKEEFRSLIGKR